MENQEIKVISPENLIPTVLQFKHSGYRLVQICATRLAEGGFEVTYSFDKDYHMEGLRILLQPEEGLVSISSVYPPAFLYENEMKDLFGIPISLLSVDYHGNLYRTASKTPFNTPKGE